MQELGEGRTAAGQPLKPIDVLLRAQALLDLGDSLATLIDARPPPPPLPVTPELVERVCALHAAYNLAAEVYRFVGIDDATLALAGIERPKGGPVKAQTSRSAARRGAA